MRITAVLNADLIRKNDDIVPVVLSTDTPIDDGFSESLTQLVHSTEAVDLSRSPLPVIEGHDSSKINIGRVENLHLDRGNLRGSMVLGTSRRAREVLEDIKAGIIRSVSIGARVIDSTLVDGIVRITRWQPLELSLVSVPADPAAGLFRSITMEQIRDPHVRENEDEPEPIQDPKTQLTRRQRAMYEDTFATFEEFTAITREYGVPAEDLDRAVKERWTAAEYSQHALKHYLKMQEAETVVHRDSESSRTTGISIPQHKTYSIARAVQAQLGMLQGNSLEREIHDDLQRDRKTTRGGFFIPTSGVPLTRDVTKAGSGGNLVGTEHMAGDFIQLLRARSFAMENATVFPGLTQDLSIPRNTGGSTAQWIVGDGSDALTESDPTFDAVTLSPVSVGSFVDFSRRILTQALPVADSALLGIMVEDVAQAIDTAAFQGSGVGAIPEGILNFTNVGSVNPATDGSPTFAEIVAMETELANVDALQGNLRYVMHPAVAQAMKTQAKDAGSGQFVWENNTVNGYPAIMSSNMPSDQGIFGNWSDLLVGVWRSAEILADPYTGAASGNVRLRVFSDIAISARHEESFCGLVTDP